LNHTKNNVITKDPVAAGRKGGLHRGERTKTKINRMVHDWAQAEGIVEKNILEFLTAKDKRTKMWATRYFAEFIKAKKRDINGSLGLLIDDVIEEDDEKR